MNVEKAEHRLEQLGRAIERLKEALDEPETNPVRIDGLIQRYEFTIELYWKTLKQMLKAREKEVHLPKDVFQEAYAAGWLGDDNKMWVSMLRDRNLTSHTYDEALAREIAERIGTYYPLLKQTYESLTALQK